MRVTVVFITLLLMIMGAAATSRAGSSGGDRERRIEDASEIRAHLGPQGLFRTPWSQSYFRWKADVLEKTGITWMSYSAFMLQQGTQASKDFTTSEQSHNIGAWQPFHKIIPEGWNGTLIAWYMHMRQPTNTDGIEFAGSLGTNFLPSDSAIEADTLRALIWSQDLFDSKLTLNVGHNGVNFHDNAFCQYSCFDTDFFIATPLSSSPVRTLPGSGSYFGAYVVPVPELEISFGIQDASADGNLNFERMFNTGEVALATEIVWRHDIAGVGHGEYRITGYHVDHIDRTNQRSSNGMQFNLEQDIGNLGFFLRGGGTNGNRTAIKRYVSGGVVWKGPLIGAPGDLLGLGASYLVPTDSTQRDEGLLEMFYRWQVTPLLQISPDVQLVFPTRGSGVQAVFTLRFQVSL